MDVAQLPGAKGIFRMRCFEISHSSFRNMSSGVIYPSRISHLSIGPWRSFVPNGASCKVRALRCPSLRESWSSVWVVGSSCGWHHYSNPLHF